MRLLPLPQTLLVVLVSTLCVSGQSWPSEYASLRNDAAVPGLGQPESLRPLWSWPSVGNSSGWPLVVDGLVLFQGPRPDQVQAVELTTGQVRWTVNLAPSQGDFTFGPAAIAGRLFIPLGANGAATSNLTSRIQAIELATGNTEWIWDSGERGAISSLQVSEAAGTAAVYCTIASRGTRGDWPAHRVFRLDAQASSASRALLASTGVAQRGPQLGYEAPAIFEPNAREPRVLVHEYSHAGAFRWSSSLVRSLRAPSLRPDSPASLALSAATQPGAAAFTIGTCPVVVDEQAGMAFVYETDGTVVAFDPSTMSLRWRSSQRGTSLVARIYALEEVIVLEDPDASALYALSRIDGSLQWTVSTANRRINAAPVALAGVVLGGQTLLMPLANGELRAIDARGVALHAGITLPGLTRIRPLGRHFVVRVGNEVRAYEVSVERLGGRCAPSGSFTPYLAVDSAEVGRAIGVSGLGFPPRRSVFLYASLPPVTPITLGACTIHVDFTNPANFVLIEGLSAQANGAFQRSYPAPPAALRGLELIVQAGTVGPFGDLGVSAALRLRIL